jgi:glycosyltransferase involved in cell wall biosynthesis
MIVNNPCIRHPTQRDARVIREAEALVAGGFEVRVFCRWWRDADVPPLEVVDGVAYARFGPAPVTKLPATPRVVADAAAPGAARLAIVPPSPAPAMGRRDRERTSARTAETVAATRAATEMPRGAPPATEVPEPAPPDAAAPGQLALTPPAPIDPVDESGEVRGLLSPLRRGARSAARSVRRALRQTRRAVRRQVRAARREARRQVRAARRALRQQARAAQRAARKRAKSLRREVRQQVRAARRAIRRGVRTARQKYRETKRELRQRSRRIAALGPRDRIRRWLTPTRRCRDVEAQVTALVIAFAPDVVHAHDLDTLPAAALAAGTLGARLVYDAHEIEIDRMPPRPWVQRLQIGWLEKRYVEQADAFVTVSPGLLTHYGAAYRLRRPMVLYNTPAFTPADRAAGDVRADCGLDADVWLGVYVGAVGPGRGVETLLEALALVPEAHLAMVGSRRPQWDELIERMVDRLGLAGRLHRLPAVPPRHVVSYIATASFGIYTMQDTCLNHRYALPNKIFEMTFAGLPIVGPDLAGIRSYIDEAGVGFTVDPENPEAIAAGIHRMALEWPRYRPGDTKLRALAARFGWPRQAATLVSLYRELTDGAAGTRLAAPARATA